jgi:hypothetical protein
MTEDRWWLDCKQLRPMLSQLRWAMNPRKKRLFLVACARRIWDRYTDQRSTQAIETAEAFADGRCTKSDLAGAREAASRAREKAVAATQAATKVRDEIFAAREEDPNRSLLWPDDPIVQAAWRSWYSVVWTEHAAEVAVWVSRAAVPSLATVTARIREIVAGYSDDYAPAKKREEVAQCDLLRDLFGDPNHRPFLSRTCLRWNGNTLARLAQVIYDERAFDRLPILADALEDAGCADAAILEHCRGPGPHVRGCWVVDLILGKS